MKTITLSTIILTTIIFGGWLTYETPAQQKQLIINCTGAGCHTYTVPPFSAGCDR